LAVSITWLLASHILESTSGVSASDFYSKEVKLNDISQTTFLMNKNQTKKQPAGVRLHLRLLEPKMLPKISGNIGL
jgi:hypothetical protein